MPNWVTNVIEMPGIGSLDLYYVNELGNPEFDFNKIVPMPEHIAKTGFVPVHLNKREEDNWYDWSRQNWGTKWNAGSTKIVSDDIVRFETAYRPPWPVLRQLSRQHPNELIYLYCYEEAGKSGSFVYRNGVSYSLGLASSKDVRDICWNGKFEKMEKYRLNKFAEYAPILY